MVVQFLSDQWFDHVNRLAAADEGLHGATAGVDLTIEQVITRPGAEPFAYFLRVHDGRLSVEPGRAPAADVVLTSQYDTAGAVSRGELSPGQALERGLVKVRGDVRLLARHHDALARVGDVFAALRETTEY